MSTDEQRTIDRRRFLKTTAAGAGTLALPALAGAVGAGQQRGGAQRAGATTDNWVEPWEFRVGRHEDGVLALNVVEVPAPAWLSAPNEAGQPGPQRLFTYNGSVPGPTIRMGGDDVLRIDLLNHLSGNYGNWAFTNAARFAKSTKVRGYTDAAHPAGNFEANELVPDVPDWQLSRTLIYGPHQQHVTNLHTHGLHVAPARNPDGTHSDNVLLRIVPTEDLDSRSAHEPPLPLDPRHEVVGQAHYEFRLGASSGTPTHPPGTHWYHPHPHGATYDQVATGMAGFLIVEGDVDDALNTAMAARPEYAYRERLILLQRIFDTALAPIQEGEAGQDRLQKGQRQVQSVNGQPEGSLRFTMQAGAIERWRVLNGSVDGQGFIRFAVASEDAPPIPEITPVGPRAPVAEQIRQSDANNADLVDWLAANAVPMQNLAFDGVTLVTPEGTYTTREVRWMSMAPANRADFLFQAPAAAGTYVIWGIGENHRAGAPTPPPIRIATITVQARDNPPGPVDFAAIVAAVPVPAYLRPIGEQDIRGTNPRDRVAGYRTRRVIYSGWGSRGYICAATETCPTGSSLKPSAGGNNGMVIDRMKFDPDRPVHKMALDSAEEWVLDNYSIGKPLENAGAVDHPFHMHQNPYWVMAILEPAWNNVGTATVRVYEFGGWTNILEFPRWQDVVPIPNNGGRVIFRSRFPDYTGSYVNHCHLLQHEDWGMMQTVEIVWDPVDANNDWDQTPYEATTNPNGPYSTPLPSPQEMLEFCQTFFELDGEIVDGKIVGGTAYGFPCVCKPTQD